MMVIFHLPPGVLPEEPRWPILSCRLAERTYHQLLDEDGRVTYTWANPNAKGSILITNLALLSLRNMCLKPPSAVSWIF